MPSRRVLTALFAVLVAGAAFGQSEFGRASGEQLELLGKSTNRPAGSIGITGSSLGQRYNATLGGTIVQDRLWFFASAQRGNPLFTPRSVVPRIDLNLGAQPTERQNVAAFFAAAPRATPNSFLSLHYTGIVSDSMFVTANISRSR